MLDTFKSVNAGVSFMLELCMLAAFGYWGFHGEKSLLVRWLLGLGTPLVVACIWGVLLVPRATHWLDATSGPLLALVLFGCAAVALYTTGHVPLALMFALSVVVNEVLLVVWRQW